MHARRKVQDAFREDGLPIEESYERHIVKFLDGLSRTLVRSRRLGNATKA